MNFIAHNWQAGRGERFESLCPSTGNVVWTGNAAAKEDVDAAVQAARLARGEWSSMTWNERADILRQFAEQLKQHRDQLAGAISQEVGKPRWESLTEVEAMIAKIPVSIEALLHRRSEQSLELGGMRGVTRYKPHGVLAVYGPFNFPGHIANGHIVPALLAGNAVVFKPSELTPLVAEETVKLWQAAGLPAGALNLVQGGPSTGAALAEHPGIDGILFTGSLKVGLALRRALVDRPETMLALELGGNNPLVVHHVSHVDAAVHATIQSAFLTSGQRCTCARRLIVTGNSGDFVERLQQAVESIRVGRPDDDPQPFMGPLINAGAAERILQEQQRLVESGAVSLVPVRRLGALGPAFLSPGVIDVTCCTAREDCEVFGPLLQLVRVDDLDAAIDEANNTQFGLVAALFSDAAEDFDRFYHRIGAGLINWNRPTTGASGKLPFGGLGKSGNHRPAGYFTIDLCNVPVASLQSDTLTVPPQPVPGFTWPLPQTK